MLEELWCWLTQRTIEDVRNLILIAAALVGLPLATWRSWVAHKQAKTSELGLDIDRFHKGVELLSGEQPTTRQAGIRMLSDLAEKSRSHWSPVMHTMLEHLRFRSSIKIHGNEPISNGNPPDLSAAFLVSCKLCYKLGGKNKHHIRGLNIYRTAFTPSDKCLFTGYMINSTFEGCGLKGIEFSSAVIRNCDFTAVVWQNCKFHDVEFVDCNFENSNILELDTKGCTFTNCVGLTIDGSSSTSRITNKR